MKYTRIYAATACAVFAAVNFSASAGAQVLVDTRFDQVQNGDTLLTVQDRGISAGTLPVKAPTSIQARPAGVTFKAATAAVDPLTAPFGIAHIEPGTDASKPGQGVELQWDLRGLHLSGGHYAVSCTVVPQDADADGLQLLVVPSWEDGAWVWTPGLRVVFKDGKIGTDSGKPEDAVPYLSKVAVKLGMEFDLDAQTWSASVDGKALMASKSYQMFQPGSGLMVGGIFLRSPAKNFLLSGFKVEKLTPGGPASAERLAAAKNPRIAWLGDSITAGYGLGSSERQSPPGVLRQLLNGNAMVGNFGLSATTLLKNGDYSYWKQWQYQRALEFAPTVAILALGTNDSKPGNWAHSAEIAPDMTALVKSLQDLPSHPKVLVLLPVPVFKTNYGISEELLAQVRPLLAQGARAAGATVVDSGPAFAGKSDWFPDGVHPNSEGAAAIAALVKGSLPVQ